MKEDAVVGTVELIAAREIGLCLVELAYGDVAMAAPPIEQRIVWCDGESAGEGCDGFAELSCAGLCDAQRDDALHVLRVGIEGGLGTGDGAGVGLGAILDAGGRAILD